MDIDRLTQALNPEIIERFREAIATGKWPDGRAVTPQQRQTCMQAVIVYEHKFVDASERTGYVPPKTDPCAPDDADDKEQALKWR